jgi:hypothetical protein
MWIALNDAYLSIVSHPKRSDLLLVRARLKGDIEAVFPRAKVHRTPERDYLYRACIPRTVVAKEIATRLVAIDYGNFKDSVRRHDRHAAYAKMWGVALNMQDQAEPPRWHTTQRWSSAAPRQQGLRFDYTY